MSSQPITSRIYQRLLYLLTNQIALQGFWICARAQRNFQILNLLLVSVALKHNNEHSTDEGHSPETSGHLLLFGTFYTILNFYFRIVLPSATQHTKFLTSFIFEFSTD